MTKLATGGDHPDLKMVNPRAAAIDIGSTMHMAADNPYACVTPVRAFGTFTQDLHDMADWFKSCGVTSVAMESTGVYWIPAFDVLEGQRHERQSTFWCSMAGLWHCPPDRWCGASGAKRLGAL